MHQDAAQRAADAVVIVAVAAEVVALPSPVKAFRLMATTAAAMVAVQPSAQRKVDAVVLLAAVVADSVVATMPATRAMAAVMTSNPATFATMQVAT